jgi:hypothetical protein
VNTVKQRSFRVPAVLASAFTSPDVTLDDLEIRRHLDTPAGMWARRVLRNENNRTIEALLGRKGGQMPLGIMASAGQDELVIGLVDDELGMFTVDGWGDVPDEVAHLERAMLVPEDVAFVARAFAEGADSVLLKPNIPVAWLAAGAKDPAAVAAPALEADFPKDAILIAIVDELDKDAVLDLVAVTPGPFLFRRHDGKWEPDEGIITALKSVSPPPTVQIDPATASAVIQQIDESTAGMPFEESDNKTVLSSGFADTLAVERALLAAAGAARANDITGHMPSDLKQYWTAGRGAAKIRWGTPRAMTRCARYLAKYVGPGRAYQTCNNLGKALGGKGVAWDVG